MSEFTNRYYPTLCIRRAEMKAMEMLPLLEKQSMLPVVLLAPWLNSIEFNNTHKIVEKSLQGIPLIADIDRHFQSKSDLPSREYFWSLLDGDHGAEKWMDLIAGHSNYIPTIQLQGVSSTGIAHQIARAKALGRGYVFRLEPAQLFLFDSVLHYITENPQDDILTIFDYGYADNSIELIEDISSYIRRLVDTNELAKFVVSGSNFPNVFSDFDDFSSSKNIAARGVFNELAKIFGNYQIFYGDWASTKPRRYDGGGSKPLPRIDFPTKSNWIIARSKEEGWSFKDAATRVTRLLEWESRPMVWGTGLIEKTAQGLPGGISTGPQAIAARVNIHLYLQNHYRDEGDVPPPQGEWIDPI
ncbi:beta family protein [Novosphingobium mangrovi (ex Huang et al. 2023)]|uniref:Beta family protein n=1 Tax=Novosphingobium mangrovi (ex Huang et al. 2023) TaxID=2976432 RepID=A0ABT2I3F3_9SPHN|nr:beta family protein [Novosphingobium mangrovi (ex Huang et al. 2023)]MCT2399323.1 beta family protein [Novosphingobium mangrovi (ex Huang et al. 2023)]